jgi:hypothetical protein
VVEKAIVFLAPGANHAVPRSVSPSFGANQDRFNSCYGRSIQDQPAIATACSAWNNVCKISKTGVTMWESMRARWNDRRKNDRGDIAKHEGKMQEIMSRYNIPRDVP